MAITIGDAARAAKALELEEEAAGPATVGEEELFCDYLSARLQQALHALEAAREEMIGKPRDFNRAMALLRKVQELRDLKRQLEFQRSRVNLAREAAGLGPLADESAAVRPTTEFRAVQAEHAARIMAALAAQPRTCPSCQAPVLGQNGKCQCGESLDDTPATTRPGAARESLA